MNTAQKVIKVFAIVLATFIIVSIASFFLYGLSFFFDFSIGNDKNNGKNFTETYQGVENLFIDIETMNVIIKKGEENRIEAVNLKEEIDASLEKGTLSIEEKKSLSWGKLKGGTITIYVKNISSLTMDTGAQSVKIEGITADRLELNQGVGKVIMKDVNFSKSKIKGGVGSMSIQKAVFHDVDLSIGIGKASITAHLLGTSKIKGDIGVLDLTLQGPASDYQIHTKKGIGSLMIDGKRYKEDTTYGTGLNEIDLEGGIGRLEVSFEQQNHGIR